jgi:hypothetical protein
LFGSIADPASPDGYFPIARIVGNWQPHGLDCGCGLWMVQSSVVEILRSSEGSNPLPLTSFGDGIALPAGAVRVRGRSQVKLWVSAEVSTINRQWFQDVGQTIEVNADCVCLGYGVPNNFVEITPLNENSTTLIREGLVVDVWLSVAITRLEAPVGDNEVCFTNNLFVPANTQRSIAVPPFAREVTIYQTTAGAASALWTQWYGDPLVVAGSVQAGALPWLAGQRRTEQESVIPDVTHLLTDMDAADRFFTLRWVIRP